jgi:cytochrome c553
MLRKFMKRSLIALALLFVSLQFIRPARTNPAIDPARTIQAHTQLTPEVEAILARACLDCHSHQTRWPWYSHVAPVSWFVIDHVNHGRSHLNFSEWMKNDRVKTLKQLEEIEEEVNSHSMPLSSYTLMHRKAKLSEADIRTITEWAQSERRRLQPQ